MPNIAYFLKKVRFCNTIPNIVRNFANYEQYSISQMNTIKNNDYSIDNEQLARFAKAMGHPARITILQFLASMDSCYFGDIHNELPIAKATVSQHLKELKDAGLIQGEIETPKVKYCINKENWEKAQTVFETFFAMRKEKAGCCN
jgi:ArsR family transcriptional regulator, arsenate/arsenite/antimonite-responsive transcriptional repressor